MSRTPPSPNTLFLISGSSVNLILFEDVHMWVETLWEAERYSFLFMFSSCLSTIHLVLLNLGKESLEPVRWELNWGLDLIWKYWQRIESVPGRNWILVVQSLCLNRYTQPQVCLCIPRNTFLSEMSLWVLSVLLYVI